MSVSTTVGVAFLWAGDDNRVVRVLAAIHLVGVVFCSGCIEIPPCPRSVDEAQSDKYISALGEGTVVGLARVQRFVATAGEGTRGYDLDMQATWHGDAAGVSTFLRLASPIPGVESGDQVIVNARSGEGSVLVPGDCPALTEIASPDH